MQLHGWHDEITAHGAWLRAGNRSPGTQALRRSHLRRLHRWLAATHPEHPAARDPWRVTEDQLIGWMSTRTWRPETRRAARSSVRSFYGWAVTTSRLQRSPALAIPAVLVPRALPRPIPDTLAAAALLSADPRGRLLIALAGAGLRACEVCRVNADDLVGPDEAAGIMVTGKGGRQRYVPLVDPALVRAVRGAAAHPGGWVFPGLVDGHLSSHYVSTLLSRLLPGAWTGHTLRHRAGTRAFQGTKNIRAVQELLGHATLQQTMLYTLVDSDDVRAAAVAAARGLA